MYSLFLTGAPRGHEVEVCKGHWSSVVQSHRGLFCGEVTGPAVLQMDSKNQQNAIKDYLEGESEDILKQGISLCSLCMYVCVLHVKNCLSDHSAAQTL